MKINKVVTKDNDLISTLKSWGFSDSLSSYLYHHLFLIKCNGKNITNTNLKENDILEITLKEENKVYGHSFNKLDILYEDDFLLVVNKPKNIATIPTIRHFNNNLSSDVANYYLKNDIHSKIHVVTRLDYETSGIVIFAKHSYIHALFRNINIDKYYTLKVHGVIQNSGTINKPIKKEPFNSKKRIISSDGKASITDYEVLNNELNYTLIRAHLITGRTHQLRVHFSSIGHPIVGDSLYGNDKNMNLELSCNEVIFKHPISNKEIHILCKN